MAAQLVGVPSPASNQTITTFQTPTVVGVNAYLCVFAMTNGATNSLVLSGLSNAPLHNSGTYEQGGSTWSHMWIVPLNSSETTKTVTITSSTASRTTVSAGVINGFNLKWVAEANTSNDLSRTLPVVNVQDALLVLGGARVSAATYPTFIVPNPPYATKTYYGALTTSGAATTSFAAHGVGGGGQVVGLETTNASAKAAFLLVSYRTSDSAANTTMWNGTTEDALVGPFLWNGVSEEPMTLESLVT